MEPLAVIVSAVWRGTAATDPDIRRACDGLMALLINRFSANPGIAVALRNLAERPNSQPRRGVLAEELAAARADEDGEIVQAAQRLLDQLDGVASGARYQADVDGGAVAQGDGATAAGAGGVLVNGDVKGDIVTGLQTGIRRPEAGIAISEAARKLNSLLEQWFSLSDLEDIAFRLGIDWDNLRGETKAQKAHALALYCESRAQLDALRSEITAARPNLRGEL